MISQLTLDFRDMIAIYSWERDKPKIKVPKALTDGDFNLNLITIDRQGSRSLDIGNLTLNFHFSAFALLFFRRILL